MSIDALQGAAKRSACRAGWDVLAARRIDHS